MEPGGRGTSTFALNNATLPFHAWRWPTSAQADLKPTMRHLRAGHQRLRRHLTCEPVAGRPTTCPIARRKAVLSETRSRRRAESTAPPAPPWRYHWYRSTRQNTMA